MINSSSTTTTTSTNTSTSSSSTSTIINGCYQMIAISHLLSVTRYLLLAKCHLSSFVFYLKLAITCIHLFPFARCCTSHTFFAESLCAIKNSILITDLTGCRGGEDIRPAYTKRGAQLQLQLKLR